MALYAAWRDARFLKINMEPLRWMSVPTRDGLHNVGFIVGVLLFNPAKTPNALMAVKA